MERAARSPGKFAGELQQIAPAALLRASGPRLRGSAGDGKIFVTAVAGAIRIRNDDRGDAVLPRLSYAMRV